jgi:hypothetical protein
MDVVLSQLRRMLAALVLGVGTIFGAKAERDQHWSVPPTMVVEDHAQDLDGRLPECV